ncbi:SMI1/KNR4 family protein [Mesobacillus subterraneus]|uniref:SMI1/KNR4 family protein n=1 Tax=Mesobacillus subterraneus TaxID=285983 RepID=UPI002040245C|nr:SMI1/KNR4 family protein [Mesobacillus subterraneus]MCM3576499.1 SMI1/KNR4 family protein [Mesobacillus subterraneus]
MLLEKSINYLKQKLQEKGSFEIYLGEGKTSNVTCKFNSPVSVIDIEQLELQTGLTLPDDYKHFLLLHNGATLFDDVEYGGECYLYDIELVLENYQDSLGNYPNEWLTIGYHYGEEIVLDCNKVRNGDKYCIMHRGASEPNGVAYGLKLSFELWLDRLIICQGLNYWNPPRFSIEESY